MLALAWLPAACYHCGMKVLSLLPLVDWLALGCFFVLWVGYALFAKRRAERDGSLIATTNRYRGF